MSTKKETTRSFVKHGLTGVSGKRARMNNMQSIRKARKEDGYNQRRKLAAQAKAQAERQPYDRSLLIEQLATRSQSLLIGLQHSELTMRQKSLRAFVYLMSSGVPPLFDDSDPQHLPLWETIKSAIPCFVAALDQPDDVSMQSNAAFALRFIASMDRAQLVIDGNALVPLMKLLQCGISELQIQAAWCLGNIASESKECCEQVVSICPPALVVPHIRMSSPSFRRAAVWLLRNLIDLPQMLYNMQLLTKELSVEMMVVLCTVMKQLISEKLKIWKLQDSTSKTTSPTVAPWRLFQVNTGNPPPNEMAVVKYMRDIDNRTVEVMDVDINFETGENCVFQVPKTRLIPIASIDDSLTMDEDDQDNASFAQDSTTNGNGVAEALDEKALTLCDSCWILVELSSYDNDLVTDIVKTEIVPRLVETLFLYQSPIMCSPILRLLGNIISYDEQCAQVAIDNEVLTSMPLILMNVNKSIREEACWILSNLAGGNIEHMQAIIASNGVMSCLLEQLAWAEYNVKREAAWAVCNILVRANMEVTGTLLNAGVLQSLASMLEEIEDPSVVMIVLEAICSILDKEHALSLQSVENSGCLARIEELCYDNNEEVSQAASHIIDTWFEDSTMDQEDEDAITMAPAIVSDNNDTTPRNVFEFQPVSDQAVPTTFNFGDQQ